MKTMLIAITGVLVASSAAVIACDYAEKQRRTTVSVSGPVPADAAAKTVTSQKRRDDLPSVSSTGKSVADIPVRHRLLSKPAAGQALDLELTFGTAGGAPMTVSINAPAVLSLAPLQRRIGAGETVRLQLVPQREGRFYVNATVSREDGATRVVSIPVQIGAATVIASKAQRTPSGELLVRMRAD